MSATIFAILVAALLPATAMAGGSSMGYTWTLGGEVLDPATGLSIPLVGPQLTLELASDSGYRGDYSLDGAPFAEVAAGATPLHLDVPVLSVHTIQTRLLYPSGEVDLTGPPTTFAVDNVGPRTIAQNAVKVRQNGRATFRFKLADQGNQTDTVTINVKTLKGRSVETLYSGSQNLSPTAISLRLKVVVPTGKYRWFAYASDGCGNKQTLVGRNTLTVTR
jgi:hypothetical protein